MPLEHIRAVLAAPDLQTRNDLIAAHLDRLESTLARTQSAVASLRDLLEHPSLSAPIRHRRVAATQAAVVSGIMDMADALPWFHGALGELRGTLAAQRLSVDGPAGGIFSNDLYSDERGPATIFIPCGGAVRPTGRVTLSVIPEVELATIWHAGPHTEIDRAYGALASYVAQHALAVDGPIREYYLVGPLETADETAWRTEVGWPIFTTADWP
jgi:effector-binding domain-containing protein